MANENIAGQETIGVAVGRTELFLEKNGRMLLYIVVALLVVAGGIYGYRALIQQPRAAKAAEMIVEAQHRFEAQTPDYALALEGDANGAGFLEVIEQYGSTPSGNLAKHYAGISYLRQGDLANAAKYLAQFSEVDGIPGAIINAQNYGLQGDVAVEQADYAKAVKFYAKAIKSTNNNLTAPMYLRKAGLAEQAQGNTAKAKALFEQIITDHPQSMDARDAEKFLGTLK